MGNVRNSIGTTGAWGLPGAVVPAILRAAPAREADRGREYRESFDVY